MGRDGRINPGIPPPCDFIAAAVNFAMVSPTQWDRDLIAHLAPERRALRGPQVMGVRRLSPANQTRLRGNRFDVIAVTKPARFREGQHALIDDLGPRPLLWCAWIRTVRFQRLLRLLWPLGCVSSMGRKGC